MLTVTQQCPRDWTMTVLRTHRVTDPARFIAAIALPWQNPPSQLGLFWSVAVLDMPSAACTADQSPGELSATSPGNATEIPVTVHSVNISLFAQLRIIADKPTVYVFVVYAYSKTGTDYAYLMRFSF